MMIKMGSFRSYIGLEEYEMKIPKPTNGVVLKPNLVDGEVIIGEADSVLRFTSASKTAGLSGSLFVTNSRLVFTSSDQAGIEESFPLLSINSLCYYEEPKGSAGKKQKRKVKLGSNAADASPGGAAGSTLFCSASTRVHELLVICSSFRMLRVSFKFSLVDQGQKICNALIHWSFPKQVDKLFYLDHCRAIGDRYRHQPVKSLQLYTNSADWIMETKITRTTGYRICLANQNYELCESLPEIIIVPADWSNVRLISLSGKLKGSRPPFWIWGDMNGSAILRMSQLHSEADRASENQFFETLRRSHPQMRPPHIYDLDSTFPVKDIRQAMTRLFEFCCPESMSTHVEDGDSKFLSHLESTKWLFWSSKVLETSLEIAESIVNFHDVIILQENESRDSSCLLGSIAQILLDARFRTTTGFFSLIQKDWIVTGHQFHSQYMHTSPLFLLFLDSIYQLLHQNPLEFEFNETLLIEVWDSCFDPIRCTFLFDSPLQRKTLELRPDLNAWYSILSKDVVSHHRDGPPESQFPPPFVRKSSSSAFVSVTPSIPRNLLNPMYRLRHILCPPSAATARNNHPQLLNCYPSLAQLRFWYFLYLGRNPEPIENILSSPSKLTVGSGTPHMKSKAQQAPRIPSPKPSARFAFSLGSRRESTVDFSHLPPGSRDIEYEQQVVDLLLAASNTTTRKSSTTCHRGDGSIPEDDACGGFLYRRYPTVPSSTSGNTRPPDIPPKSSSNPSTSSSSRKNPFLEVSLL